MAQQIDFESAHRPRPGARRYQLTVELEFAPGNLVRDVRLAVARDVPVTWDWQALDADGCVRGTAFAWLDEAQAAAVEHRVAGLLVDAGAGHLGSLVCARPVPTTEAG